MNILVGKKLNMSQYFAESGEVIPVTVVKFTPMVITQVKTKEGKDGYNAVQVGVPPSIAGSRKVNKPEAGHLKGAKNVGKILEFRTDETGELAVGATLDGSAFQIGELVNVEGIMKGRGFTGAMKRHGFAGFPASHGHDRPRSVGSIGQRFPQHTRKGLRMSGHYGNSAITVKNLQVVDVDLDKRLMMIKGAVPGHRNALIKITSTGKVKPLFIEVKGGDDKKKK